MNDQRPTCWPCSADSSRKAGPSPRSFRNAETGVSQSSMKECVTGIRLWSPVSARASSSVGETSRCSATAALHEALPALERVLAQRDRERPEGSYTTTLLADPPLIGDKVREEADEVARAAAGESDERVAEEAADVLYHLDVLLRSRGLTLAEAEEVLNARRR